MGKYLIGCDWGSSALRLRLISIPDHQLVGEVLSHEGVVSTFDAWKKIADNDGISREQFFRGQLKKQINVLSKKLSVNLDNTSIIISGMASSSIGMEEVPYAGLPFAVDGSQASIRCFEGQDKFPHKIILISGVRSQHDVLRGEETQLIGLIALLDPLGDKNTQKEAIWIFPGTHSKHIYIRNSQLINFQTFMTGELFNLMANHSILKDSVENNGFSDFSENNIDAFKLGLKESGSSNVLNGLFTVRTNQLFHTLNKQQNSFYLSGLLIGTELNHLLKKENWQLVLCSGSNLSKYYKLAIEELHLADRTDIVPSDLIDKAAFAGQIRIYENLKPNINTTIS